MKGVVILWIGGLVLLALGVLAVVRGAPVWVCGLDGALAGMLHGTAIGMIITSKRGKS